MFLFIFNDPDSPPRQNLFLVVAIFKMSHVEFFVVIRKAFYGPQGSFSVSGESLLQRERTRERERERERESAIQLF